MIKQTSGVPFTAAGLWWLWRMLMHTPIRSSSCLGVSTCLWRGIHARDVLLASGLQDQPDHERWYLHFEGIYEAATSSCRVWLTPPLQARMSVREVNTLPPSRSCTLWTPTMMCCSLSARTVASFTLTTVT